jgi:hypothetical protein
MKIQFICLVFTLCLVYVGGCDSSILPPDDSIFELEPLPGVAIDIKLEIRSADRDLILDKWDIPTEGETLIKLEYNPQNNTNLCVLASANGFYNEIYNCTDGQVITVDLDAHMEYENSIAGVLTGWQNYPDLSIHYPEKVLPNTEMIFCFADDRTFTVITDEQGRYGLGNVPSGSMTIHFENEFIKYEHLTEGDSTYYKDIFVGYTMVSYAPNIYLYPEKETDVHVNLGFPNGGEVITSEPEYNSGWLVHVTPEGRIDDKYDFLFYESALPDLFKTDSGWVFSCENLEAEFRSVLSDFGFAGREIEDFIDFWIPVLVDASYFAFYPQDVDKITTLNVSPQPVSVLRVYLLIKPLSVPIDIPQPAIPRSFDRNGFTVVEWGVIGMPGLVTY